MTFFGLKKMNDVNKKSIGNIHEKKIEKQPIISL